MQPPGRQLRQRPAQRVTQVHRIDGGGAGPSPL
jgi:hypothetical protein